MLENEKDLIPESRSYIEIPSKLILMPGERLLEKHIDFYVSNKRIIQHNQGFLSANTKDHSFRHIKGLEEIKEQPFLALGLLIGFVSLFVGLLIPIFFIIGAIFIILAIWYKKFELVVYHIDGSRIKIPKIKTETGKNIAGIIRTRIYNDEY